MARKNTERKKVTLVDVARHAGVSRATASLVLRKSPLVADKTREKVLASMRALGYVYNRSAASLRSRRSQAIGLVITDITNPFFAELAVSIETQLSDAGYAVLLSNTMEDTAKQERLLHVMNGHQVDGVFLCPAQETTGETIELLQRWRLPGVMVARYIPGVEYDYAGVDNQAGAAQAVEHLYARGHRRIAFLGGHPMSSARRDRYRGYLDALRRLGLEAPPDLSVTSPATRRGGYEALVRLLDLPEPPTAVLCYNDVVAFGALHALQARHRTPGRDFGVVGFDDVADASLVRPALTTVAIEPDRIGRAATDLLLARIESPDTPPRRIILPTRLVVRASS